MGCAKVSPGCQNCYAERENRRFAWVDQWGPDGQRRIASAAYWRQPLIWECKAAADGIRRRVFCGSLMDVFEDRSDLVAPRSQLWQLIEERPHLDWLLLTKRIENVMRMVPEQWLRHWPANVWPGATVENRQMAILRIPPLLRIPAAVRFVSCEPLLGEVDLSPWIWGNRCPDPQCGDSTWDHYCMLGEQRLHWVIAGGESGPDARPVYPDWVRRLRDQCQAAGVPFFFKQWGEFAPYDGQTKDRVYLVERSGAVEHVGCWDRPGSAAVMEHVGRKAAGDLLDGRAWHEFPEARQ
jgi:protein gp37